MTTAASGPVKHRFIPGAQGLLHALEFGHADTDAFPLVLLHGVTGHAWLWHDVAQRLATERRVIAYDLRGHGDSQWSADASYDTGHHIADLQAVVDALGLRRCVIAGLSWGALIGIGFAVRHPQRVERLAIIDVEASFTVDQDAVPPRPAEFARFEDALAWERNAHPRASQDLLALFTQQSLRPTEGGRWVRKHDPYFLRRWPFRRDDRWLELQGLKPPTLLLHGARSFVQVQVMRAMAARIAQAQFDEIGDCGHLVALEAPVALAERLARFMAAR